MKNRLLTAAVGIPLVFCVLLFSHTLVLPIAIALICAVGVYEMLGCTGVRKNALVTAVSMTVAAALPFVAFYANEISKEKYFFAALMLAVMFVYIFVMLCTSVFSHGKLDVADTALAAATTVYTTVGFVSLVMLRSLTDGVNDKYGICLFVLVFVGAWIPDGAGYFGGRAFGKHKLIPDVSPKKTVEGAVFGVVFGGISFVLAGLVFDLLGFGTPNYIALAVSGIVIAVISIFGDLIASLIKRKYGVKDYGKLFPGHGGVMDRFDSIIAISPFLYLICCEPSLMMLIK